MSKASRQVVPWTWAAGPQRQGRWSTGPWLCRGHGLVQDSLHVHLELQNGGLLEDPAGFPAWPGLSVLGVEVEAGLASCLPDPGEGLESWRN